MAVILPLMLLRAAVIAPYAQRATYAADAVLFYFAIAIAMFHASRCQRCRFDVYTLRHSHMIRHCCFASALVCRHAVYDIALC